MTVAALYVLCTVCVCVMVLYRLMIEYHSSALLNIKMCSYFDY